MKDAKLHKYVEKVELDNDRIRVLRVTLGAREKIAARTRRDRVIIWLTESHKTRAEHNGQSQELRRRAGEVAWRPASKHEIENLADTNEQVIIVELKR